MSRERGEREGPSGPLAEIRNGSLRSGRIAEANGFPAAGNVVASSFITRERRGASGAQWSSFV